jgi:hypothetical protein
LLVVLALGAALGLHVLLKKEGTVVKPASDDKALATHAVDNLLEQIRRKGVDALIPVLDASERPVLSQLREQLQKTSRTADKLSLGLDYRRDTDVPVKAAGAPDNRTVTAVIRRFGGEGDFTFHIEPGGQVLCGRGSLAGPLTAESPGVEELTNLPASLTGLIGCLTSVDCLRQIQLFSNKESFVVFYGLAGNRERADRVVMQVKKEDQKSRQIVSHLTVLERPIPAVVRLRQDGSAVERLLRLDDVAPLEFLRTRLMHLTSRPAAQP